MTVRMSRLFINPNLRYFEGEDGGGAGAPAGDMGGEGNPAPDSGGGESLNPAWNPLLEKLPSGYHTMVAPILKDWDKNFDTKLHEVQSQYEPYKDFVENKVDPQQLRAAMEFYRLAETDPKAIYEQMGEYFGFSTDQGQQQQSDDGEETFSLDGNEDITQHPKFQELMQNQQSLAQVLMAQHEKEQMAAAEAELDTEIATIKESHPDMSEQEEVMMLQLAAATGRTLTEAAEQLFGYKEQVAQQFAQGRPTAPSVMSATGTVPGQTPIDPTKLDNKSTRALVAQLMANQG